MVTKQELANDPDIIAASKTSDELLPLLSPMARAVVLVSRKIVARQKGVTSSPF